MRRRYQTDPAFRYEHKSTVKQTKQAYAKEIAALLVEFKVNGCSRCGETEPCCLTAHHIDPEAKLFDISSVRDGRVSPARVLTELQKCICLCMNCHAKTHAGLFGPPPVPRTPKSPARSPNAVWPPDDELAAIVWKDPVTEVARRLGVSSTAVKKRCKQRGISTPPRGYWSKTK